MGFVSHESIADIEITSGQMHRSFLNHSLGEGDAEGNKFGIRLLNKGTPVDLTGQTIIGYFNRPNGDTVVINGGTCSGPVGWITLPQACYVYEGNFSLTIKLADGELAGTYRIVDGVIVNTTSNEQVDPGSTIPDLTELLARISEMETATEECENVTEECEDFLDNLDDFLPGYDEIINFRGGAYNATDGTYDSSVSTHGCTETYLPRAYLARLSWYPESDSSWRCLKKDGEYVGFYMNRKYYTPAGVVVDGIDFDEFALSLSATDLEGHNCYLLGNYGMLTNHLNETEITWVSGVYDQTTGYFNPGGSGYVASSERFPQYMLPLLKGYTGAEGYSFLTLYMDEEYVGSYYSGAFHLPGQSTTTARIEFNQFEINIYTNEIPNYQEAIYFATIGRINRKIENSGIYTENVLRTNTATGIIAAVNTAILNASKANRYKIIIEAGTYELWDVLDHSKLTNGDQLYRRGLELPDYCSLQGEGTVVIQCTIPESENSAEHPYSQIVSTLNLHNTECIIENIQFIGNNTRYCIHDDSGFGYVYRKTVFKNCKFKHTGTESQIYMPDPRCYGAGFVTGREVHFINCQFESSGNVGAQLYIHTHTGNDNISDVMTFVESCAFKTANMVAIDYQVPWSTNYGGKVTVDNCYFASGDSILLRGVNATTLFGGGNSAVTINNQNGSAVYLVQ